MKWDINTNSLAEAERLLNGPLPIPAEMPNEKELTTLLDSLAKDEPYSIKHRPPPPLWTEVGNPAVQAYYQQNSDHPMADDDHARMLEDADVAISEKRARRGEAPPLKQAVYKALVDARHRLPDTLWSRI